jgi:hypothetical protein
VCESLLHDVMDGVVLHTDVFDIHMMGVVLSKKTGRVIITMEWGAVGKRIAQALEQFSEEDELFPSVV